MLLQLFFFKYKMIKKAFLWILNIQQMREILANLEHKPKNIINYFFLSKYLEIKYQKNIYQFTCIYATRQDFKVTTVIEISLSF